ncbi:MAG: hypothetical protein K8F91_20275, partial [Candidatus Obscuribacterales bacterium]|nr:hypothetical protein [Candidatus Obscuribacterales bacterium]
SIGNCPNCVGGQASEVLLEISHLEGDADSEKPLFLARYEISSQSKPLTCIETSDKETTYSRLEPISSQ